MPDGSGPIDEHPDLQDLQEIDESVGFTREWLAKADLFKASRDLVNYHDIPVGGGMILDNGEQSLLFTKEKKPDEQQDVWYWHKPAENPDEPLKKVPVVLRGPCATPSATMMEFNNPVVREREYFIFAEQIMFHKGTDEGVPEIYKIYDDPATINPKILADYLKMGTIVRDKNGKLFWKQGIEYIVGPIQRCASFGPEALRP